MADLSGPNASPSRPAPPGHERGRTAAAGGGWGAFLFPTGPRRELVRWIALLLMAFDHWAAWTAPGDLWLRLPGRVVYPIFALFMGASLARGFPVRRYVRRLIPFALVAQLGFVVFFWPTYAGRPVLLYWNILFTLLLGALAWDALRRRAWIELGAVFLLAPFVDYGVAGVLAVVLSARLAEAKPGAPPLERLANGAALFAVWLALNVQPGRTPAELALTFGAWLTVPLLWLLARLPLGLPRGPWWVPYAYYPAHFVVLYILRLALGR
ncbi:TraX family protein [Hydrogenibacillus schlegelii]|uniref:TraX protein n=1 Tax=Hydrogenibacillus schlegelii TaxID=1484 RepID=A0A179IQ47_HYDSH|nr:TraX family protein [Hydrogenibacillus schlegelii]OAR03584.1 hypothetical protein SA87_02840 [Hydrogenibacillus schlegelii]